MHNYEMNSDLHGMRYLLRVTMTAPARSMPAAERPSFGLDCEHETNGKSARQPGQVAYDVPGLPVCQVLGSVKGVSRLGSRGSSWLDIAGVVDDDGKGNSDFDSQNRVVVVNRVVRYVKAAPLGPFVQSFWLLKSHLILNHLHLLLSHTTRNCSRLSGCSVSQETNFREVVTDTTYC